MALRMNRFEDLQDAFGWAAFAKIFGVPEAFPDAVLVLPPRIKDKTINSIN